MESLKEILNNRKQHGSYSISFQTDNYADECEICNSAKWIIENNETIPCSCQTSIKDNLDYKIRLKYSGLEQLVEYDLKNFKVDGSKGKTDATKLRSFLSLAKDFSKNPMGWLVINGPTGTGKTHLAAGIALKCVENGNPVIFKSIQEVIDIITNSGSEEDSYKDLIDYPFLIIDDYGNQNYSDWIEEKIDHLFTHRYTRKLPTVIVLSKNLFDLNDRVQMRFSDPNLVQSINIEPIKENYLSNGIPKVFEKANLTKELKKPIKNTSQSDKVTYDSIEMALFKSKEYVSDKNPSWLYIHGETGSGKSYLSAAIANQLIKKGKDVYFISTSELIDKVRGLVRSNVGKGPEYEKSKEVEFLILDDLWGHNNTKWSDELLYNLIVFRQDNLKPTIINSSVIYDIIKSYNPKKSQISSDSIFTEKICSRIANRNIVEQISLVSSDIRKKNLIRKV
ncbi:MAG: ATP-binding protein [Dehalococcoidales bacterium]|nr:ATP-binding protein [Dehalococcoidales bacterium]